MTAPTAKTAENHGGTMLPQQITHDDLRSIQAERAQARSLKEDGCACRITVHMGTCGLASGAKPVYEALQEAIQKHRLEHVEVITSGCIGLCSREPLVTVEYVGMEPIIYADITADTIKEIVEEHVCSKKPVTAYALARGLAVNEEPLMYDDPGARVPHISKVSFFGRQRSWVLRNRGLIDPENLSDYIWRDGYRAASLALNSMDSSAIIDEVKESGLRGRGGGGFPTGLKWQYAAQAKSARKYVLCNADEGDPGAFMDRSVMEGDPHAVIEGMIIAAKAIGASQGYIYCRAEYPLAVHRLTTAIRQCREHGLLGKDSMGSSFCFDIDIYQGAGAFVCGEETALIASIEGKRGMPRPRPPFPAVSGLRQQSTILNNVETYAAVPQILLKGHRMFSSLGTESSRGTKVFALTGKVNRIGLVEVPMGTTLRQIIYDIGGGIPENRKFKAAQLGGPSGGCIPAEHLDIPTDYEAVSKVGAIMGSGGLIVMDEDTCMVDMARFFMDFCQDESCGKCSPCRVGTRRMLDILEGLCRGEGRPGDIELLEDMASGIKDSALCGLGQTAPNPVLSTIRYFREEYEEHINGYCTSNVCKAISPAPCQRSCPIGMDVPSYAAYIAWGRLEDALEVMHEDNPFPAVCGRLCPRPCETTCLRTETDTAVSIRALKRYAADQVMEHLPRQAAPITVVHPERIAVIGAGPCGLTAAHDLAGLGYAVTVYESNSTPGGMLRHAVPDFRLPREVVDREIHRMLPMMTIQTGKRFGSDLSLDSLKQEGFDAVLLAMGAPKLVSHGFKRDDCIDGVKFLMQAKQGKAKKLKGTAVVIGFGHLAWDCARTALRLGADQAVMLYPRREEDIPANQEELEDLAAEGGRVEYACIPVEIIKKGRTVTGIQCRRTEASLADQTGRMRMREAEGSEFTLDCSYVIAAAGNQPDASNLDAEPRLRLGMLDTVKVDPVTLETAVKGVFAAGDLVTAGATVIEAIASGQKAAASIHRKLRNMDPSEVFKRAKPRRRVEARLADDDLPEAPRVSERRIADDLRKRTFGEAVLRLTLHEAQEEARRCLRCDLD